MTDLAISALGAEIEEVRKLIAGLRTEQWQLPSACDGWSVADVVAHLAATWHALVDPVAAPAARSEDTERRNEISVAQRRSWDIDEIRDEYESYCGGALEVLRAMQDPDVRDNTFAMGRLGSYPMHLLADALTFDHYTHLREDLLAPLGPVRFTHSPEPADLAVTASMNWMLAAMSVMCDETLAPTLTIPIALTLTGPGAGRWVLSQHGGKVEILAEPQQQRDVAGEAFGTTSEFISWGTQRRDWRRCGVRLSGDVHRVALALDRLKIV